MYLGRVSCNIGLGNYKILGANAIEIKESIHSIIWTCNLVMPNYVVVQNGITKVREPLESKIKVGDFVSVAYGYDGNDAVEFEGYVSNINHTVPLEIECENVAYMFRKVPIKKVFNQSLKSVLQFLITEVNKATGTNVKLRDNIPEMEVENFEAIDRSALWVLQQLADQYPMYAIYFKGDALHCHLRYFIPSNNVVKYVIDRNTFGNDSLKYNDSPEDVRIVLEVKNKAGKVVKKEFGSPTANKVITKRLSGMFAEDALKKIADQEMHQTAYAGFKGSFLTFSVPETEIPVVANISHPEFEGRAGKYIIGTQTKSLDTSNGIFKKLEIDFKLPR